jgi:hypothetical protein
MQWLLWGGVRIEKARGRTMKEAAEAVNVALATIPCGIGKIDRRE